FAVADDDSLNLESTGTATLNATVNRTTFTNAPGDLFQASIDGSGGGDVVFTNNTLSNASTTIAPGVGGVTLEGARGGTTTFTVANNTLRDARGMGLLVVHGQGTSRLTATVTGNHIGAAGVANSGSREGAGLVFEHNGGGGVFAVDATGNDIRQFNAEGISLVAGAGVAESGQLSARLVGNVIAEPGVGATYGLLLNSGVTTGDTFASCLDLGANSIATARLRQRQNTTVKLVGYAGSPTDTTAVNAFVASRLGGSPTVTSAFTSTGFTGGTSCP
ncbi:MAG TPA: hypothetical protein VM712_13900, partial [Gaiellales bacterium]|nr:hypothetical protein [Gaiellales bacterium]